MQRGIHQKPEKVHKRTQRKTDGRKEEVRTHVQVFASHFQLDKGGHRPRREAAKKEA